MLSCSVVLERIKIPDALISNLRIQRNSSDLLNCNETNHFVRNSVDINEMCQKNSSSSVIDISPASSIVPLATSTPIHDMLKKCRPCSVLLHKLDLNRHKKNRKKTKSSYAEQLAVSKKKLQQSLNFTLPSEEHKYSQSETSAIKAEDLLLMTVKDYNERFSALPQEQMSALSNSASNEQPPVVVETLSSLLEKNGHLRSLRSGRNVPYKVRKFSRDGESSSLSSNELNHMKSNGNIPIDNSALASCSHNLSDDTPVQEQMSSLQKEEPKQECLISELDETSHYRTRSTKNYSPKKELAPGCDKKISTFQNHLDKKTKIPSSSKGRRKSSLSFQKQHMDKGAAHNLRSSKKKKECSSSCQKKNTDIKSAASLRKKQNINSDASSPKKSQSKKSVASIQKSSTENKKTRKKTSKQMKNISFQSIKGRKRLGVKSKKKIKKIMESLPIDDISLYRRKPVVKNTTPKSSKCSGKSFSQRRKLASDAVKEADRGYEDDMFASKSFEFFIQLNVDTSYSPVSSSRSTPELGFHVPPRVSQRLPESTDYFPPERYAVQRQIALDCLERKRRKKTETEAQHRAQETLDVHEEELDIDSVIENARNIQTALDEAESPDNENDDEDSYFVF